jgi:response regulator RpfG family c-di-GMP phosphodiesterase
MTSMEGTSLRTLLVVGHRPSARLRLIRTLMFEVEARILEASSSAAALEILRAHRVDVVLAGHEAPNFDGLGLLRQVRERHPHVVRLLIARGRDLASATRAIGAADVNRGLREPLVDAQLVAAVRLAFADAELQAELTRLRALQDIRNP